MDKKRVFNNSTFRFVTLIVFLFICWILGRYFNIDFQSYRSFLLRFPLIISGLIFVLLYVGVTFFAWLAKDLFKVLGAVVFGAYLSAFFIWAAEIINVAILFNLSRKLGRGFIEKKIGPKLTNLDKKIEESGFWGIFALRIIPLVPFRFLDLAAGLTKISLRKYFTISVFASPLRIFWIQFVLAGIGQEIIEGKSIIELVPSLTGYISGNTVVFFWSFLYFIAATVLLLKLRK